MLLTSLIQDFRSEDGLYSLIQAQFDTAKESSNNCEFSEPPPAKRRRLARSASAAALNTSKTSLEQRQLRTSQSFHTATSLKESTADLADANIVSDQSGSLNSSQSSQSSGRRSLPNLKGKDLFDSMIWSDPLTTSVFFTFITSLRKKIFEEVKATTKTHQFLKTLRDGGRLVRVYTQNIDGLEGREGLSMDLSKGPGSKTRFGSKVKKLETEGPSVEGEGSGSRGSGGGSGTYDRGVECVQLHGGLEHLRCGLCARLTSWDDEDRDAATLAGDSPDCPHCTATNTSRESRGRRSLAIGRLRPDVVLYGEEHPCAGQIGPLITHDISLAPEIMLILGTSLRVHGLKFMVREFAKAVHTRGGIVVFVNNTKPPDSIWGDVIDFWVEGDCDSWVEDLGERRKDLWLPQGYMDEKEQKPRAIPKNPQSTRPDTTCGAYFMHKIIQRLGRLSGRISDEIPDQQLLDAQLLGTSVTAATEDKPKPPKKKRKSAPRPMAIREDRFSGAFVSAEITAALRRILEGESRELPVLPGLGHWQPARPNNESSKTKATKGRQALAPISSNSTRKRPRLSKKALPTPPASDESSPTPTTPRSIRTKMSIGNLLSSPMAEERYF